MDLKLLERRILIAFPALADELTSVNIETEPFFYFGNIGLFLSRSILRGDTNAVSSIFALVNELLDINDSYLDELIIIGILEVLTDYQETQVSASRYLSNKGKTIFDSLFDRFNRLY